MDYSLTSMKPTIWILLLAAILAGCSPHNIFNVQTRVSIKPISTNHYPALAGKVFLTQMAFPKEMQAERLAIIDVGTVTTQSPFNVTRLLADRARELGANAVFDVKVWKQMSGFSPQAPQASGIAIRLADTNSVAGFSGSWY